MQTWKKYCAGLAAMAGLTPGLWAQAAGLAGAAAQAGQTAAAAGAAQQAGSPLIALLCPSPDQAKMLKDKFCNNPLGKLLSNGLKPISVLTGGILGECCPSDPAAQFNPEAGGAEGVAGAIAVEEANAKKRRAAARFLGTVDCHYFPEVTDALVGLLRQDRNECVRLEAALALGRGCCCNKTTIQALAYTVTGSKKDKGIEEKSERVKAAAAASLHHCLACLGEVPPPKAQEPVKEPEKRKEPESAARQKADPLAVPAANPVLAYYRAANEQISLADAVEQAQQALQAWSNSTLTGDVPRSGGRSLADVFLAAVGRPAASLAAGRESVDTTAVAEIPTAEPLRPVAAPLQVAVADQPPPAPPRLMTPLQVVPALPPTASGLTPQPVSQPVATPVTPTVSKAPPVTAETWSQLVLVLRESLYPEQRAWAAGQLGASSGPVPATVVRAVIASATSDPAANVRVACVHCLGRVANGSTEAVSTLMSLRQDKDQRVRQEAEQILLKLGTLPSVTPAFSGPRGQP